MGFTNNLDLHGHSILYVSRMSKDILWYDNTKRNKLLDFKNVLLAAYILCVRTTKSYFAARKKEGNATQAR